MEDFAFDLMENISIQLTGKRLLQFDGLSVMQTVVNESIPLGYALTQLKAHVVDGFDGDDEQIRFDITVKFLL